MFQTVPQAFAPQQSPSPPLEHMLAVPENVMVTTGPNGEPKPRKMRASCDACSRAKVKCDKVRPMCHRCGNMGICCNYSPSMRLGKPRKNRNPDGTIMRDGSPASSRGLLGSRPDMIPRTAIHTAESSPEPSDGYLFCPATPEYTFQDTFMANGFESSRSPAYSETSSHFSNWSGEEQLMYGNPVDMFAPMPQYLAPHSPYISHMRASSVQSQPEMFVPLEVLPSPPIGGTQFFGMPDPTYMQQDKMMASPPPMASTPLPTPPASISATIPNHDCTQFAFQTLNSLYAPPDSQPSAVDFDSNSNGLPTLDAVLSINKSAVDRLYILLSCPCSTNPHFSTTIAFTIVKILSWYQAIAGASDQDIGSILDTKMEAFKHTPISLGSFRLEAADENTFRTNLVLSELRKVEKLIDKFAERYCRSANSAETGIDGGVYVALEALLRTRVRDTFKITMRTAPEDVKRQVASRTQNRARVHTL